MTSLAARCNACGTVFRVVQDQLRVAGGLVRCGRCGEVFNATESLIDLETEGLGATPAPMPMPPRPPPPPPPPPTLSPSGSEPDTHFDLRMAPLPAAFEADRVAGPARFEPALDADFDYRAEPDDQPAFVKRAERAQRWRQPRVRLGLASASVLGLLLLLGQAGYTYRDLLAARQPELRPALLAVCQALGCRIEPARAIDSLAVESSGLVRVEKSGIYKLQLAIRNRAPYAVALPALDLTLSDSQGKVLARRVLRTTELGVTEATLAGGRELPLQATLQTALQPAKEAVAGYTIELFYP